MPSDTKYNTHRLLECKESGAVHHIASLLYLSLDELLNDRIGVLLGRRLSSKVSCDSLTLSNRLQRGVSVVPIAAGTKSFTHRKSSMLNFIGVFVQVHVPIGQWCK